LGRVPSGERSRRTHRNDRTGSDRDCLSNGELPVHRDNFAVMKDQIGIRPEERERAEKNSQKPEHGVTPIVFGTAAA